MDTFDLVLISVVLYGIANAVLNYVERIRGARFAHRRPMLFLLIMGLAVIAVKAMSLLTRTPA